MEQFDPYRMWFGIPPNEQPPNLYRLLGIAPFEADPNVIAQAADWHMARLAGFQGGEYAEAAQFILNELSASRACLLDPAQKARYDQQLQQEMWGRGERQVASPPPPANSPMPGYGGQPAAAGNGFPAPGTAPPGYGSREVPMPAFNLPPPGSLPPTMPAAPNTGYPAGYPGHMAAPQGPAPIMSGTMPAYAPHNPGAMPLAAQFPAAQISMMPLAAPIPAPTPAPSPIPAGVSAPALSNGAAANAPVAPPTQPPPATDAELRSIVAAGKSSGGRRRPRQKDGGVPKEVVSLGIAGMIGLLILGVWLIVANTTGPAGLDRLAHPDADKKQSSSSDKIKKTTADKKKEKEKTSRFAHLKKPTEPATPIAVQPRLGVRPAPSRPIGPDAYGDDVVGMPNLPEPPESHEALQVPRDGLDQGVAAPAAIPAPAPAPVEIQPAPKPAAPPRPAEDHGPSDDAIGLPPVVK